MAKQLINNTLFRVIFGLSVFSVVTLSLIMAETQAKVDQENILAIGKGKITAGNIAAARTTAISEALVKGVEEYLARRLGSQGMINNFERLIHDIIPGSREEIENFHILAEEQTDKYCKLLVRIKVNEKLMEEKLREMGLILMEGPPIKVLFLVSQSKSQEASVSYWWNDPYSVQGLITTELALHRVFQERGFRPINRLANVPEETYSPEMKILDLSDEDVVRWGRFFSADVVIHGKCEIVEGEFVFITLKAFDIGEGMMIFRGSQIEVFDKDSDSMEDVIQPIERVVNNIAIKLGPEIIKAIEVGEDEINKIDIEIQGLKSFEQFRMFSDFLKKDIHGVESVIQTRIKSNSISIRVVFSGKKNRFMDMVLEHESFPFLADVRKTEKGEIIINIK
ncbi:MAG: hypothetical protein JRC68_01560 [Deltaproteobacteria bacterium]|nr:hypothetical protein [Deltaproteobacteria bacterium]